jgi:hypothetical protein
MLNSFIKIMEIPSIKKTKSSMPTTGFGNSTVNSVDKDFIRI